MSRKSIAFAVATVASMIVFGSCNTAEVAHLRSENDSLRHELEVRNKFVSIVKEVQSLIDSIDASRSILRERLTEGTSAESVTARLRDIHQYIEETQQKIAEIEKELGVSSNEANAYLMMVDALKGEVSIRESEIENLEIEIATLQRENQDLLQLTKFQEAELADMQTQINTKQRELDLLEAKVEEMVRNLNISEAEAYFARARAVEEAARRTRLAPSRKKETYREALELYKKALSLGKQEARGKITELERKI